MPEAQSRFQVAAETNNCPKGLLSQSHNIEV